MVLQIFIKSEIQANPAPKYILNTIIFLGDLQHFLDHGGECDFSKVFSTSDVRKHLAPANRFKKLGRERGSL